MGDYGYGGTSTEDWIFIAVVFMTVLAISGVVSLILWGVSINISGENISIMDKSLKRLSPNWGIPIAITAIAFAIGAALGGTESVIEEILKTGLKFMGDPTFYRIGLGVVALIMLPIQIVRNAISFAMNFGVVQFFLKFTRNIHTEVSQIFEPFKNKNTVLRVFGANFMIGLFCFLWSLLLLVPGIIAAYSYMMTLYIMADEPDLPVMEALRKSKAMMDGRKAQLFWLHMRFTGWHILSSMTLFIGYLWLMPYINVAVTNFYDVVKADYEAGNSRGFHPTATIMPETVA